MKRITPLIIGLLIFALVAEANNEPIEYEVTIEARINRIVVEVKP